MEKVTETTRPLLVMASSPSNLLILDKDNKPYVLRSGKRFAIPAPKDLTRFLTSAAAKWGLRRVRTEDGRWGVPFSSGIGGRLRLHVEEGGEVYYRVDSDMEEG